MTSVLIWLGLAWAIAIGMALRWWRGLPREPWLPEDRRAAGLCTYCQEPALLYVSGTSTVCQVCGAMVERGLELWRCREEGCDALVQGRNFHRQRGRCRNHATWVELRERARREYATTD